MTDSSKINEDQISDVEVGKGEAFNYDDILEHLGQIGKFQLHTVLWLCVPAFFPGIVVMSYTFTGGIPDYRCYIEGCDGFANSTETNLFTPSWLNNTIPWDDNSPNKCVRYNHTWTDIDECQEHESPTDTVKECDRWLYDQSLFSSTIVTEFDLTCDNQWKQTLVSTTYMFGMLIGAAVLGSIADAIGRRLAFSLNVLALATVTTCLAFSPNFTTFCVLRFFSGATAVGHFLILFVWGVEVVGKNYRVMVGLTYNVFFSSGSAVLGVVAYYVRDWKTLQLIISVPMFLLVGIFWIVPESIRWLIIKKRYVEARQVTKNSPSKENTSENTLSNSEKDKPGNPNINQKNENIIDVFRSPTLFKRLAIMSLAWIASVMGYFGMTFATTNLTENFYLNYELSIVMEFPANLAGVFIIKKFGRRSTLSVTLILSGIACLITGLADCTTVQIIFSLIGKLFISLVFATVFVYTSELFPTSARIASIGLCSTSGRIGGIIAPIIATAGRENPALPFIVFAIINIFVGILSLLLPETKNRSLPATVQQAEDLEKYTFSCLQCRGTSNKTTECSTD